MSNNKNEKNTSQVGKYIIIIILTLAICFILNVIVCIISGFAGIIFDNIGGFILGFLIVSGILVFFSKY